MIKITHGVLSKASFINNLTNVRIFSTHAGNGSSTQYANYPLTLSEFDKLFNTSYTNTSLSWSGTLSPSVSINWSVYTTLTSAGATVPNSGNYFSVEVTFILIPLETGNYEFFIDSDDGSDLKINGSLVASYYGGHGTGQGSDTGIYSMTAGERYTVIARSQEYGGGEGLIVKWKRPSQSVYSLQTNEVFKPR